MTEHIMIQPSISAPKKYIQYIRIGVLVFLHLMIVLHGYLYYTGRTTYGHTDILDVLIFLERGAVRICLGLFIVWLALIPIFGRVLCGWFCHMGATQGFLAWILEKLHIQKRRVVHFRYLKWGLPAFLLVGYLIPVIVSWFQNGFFSNGVFVDSPSRGVMENQGVEAIMTLVVILLLPVLFFGTRSICRTICPFSLFFRPLQGKSLYTIRKVGECDNCGECSKNCPMGIDVRHSIQAKGAVNDLDCIRCMTCVSNCKVNAISFSRKGISKLHPETPAYDYAVVDRKTELLYVPFILVGAFLMALSGMEKLGGHMMFGATFFFCVAAVIVFVRRKWFARN